jgi:peroxiredoxin Q/BCP
MLKPGSQAPEVALQDQDGRLFRLSSLRGKGPVVVFFYPKDETMICTKEACGFRDIHHEFVEQGATVIGISADSPSSHKAFALHRRLPFVLLSDPGDVAYRAFGLRYFLGLKQRATFVVDTEGIIRSAFSNRRVASRHVRLAIATLRDQRFTRS